MVLAFHSAPLTGRTRELDLAAEALDRLRTGDAPMLVVAGEPGIGKTRILTEVGEMARRGGCILLRGSASELEREYPFALVIDAVDRYLSDLGPGDLVGLTAEQRALLAEVFPALSGLRGAGPGDVLVERYRAHHAIRVLLERLAERVPLALLLDDIHWTDEASIELLAHLARRPPKAPVLVVVATRRAQTPPGLDSVFDTAERAGQCIRMVLAPLTAKEADELLGHDIAPDRRRALHRESGGNPFYLEQLARAAREESAAGAAPVGIARTMQRELAGLSEDVRLVAGAAAVAGDPIDPDLVAAAAAVTESQATAALDELAGRDVVRLDEEGKLRFRHPIVRRAVYDDAEPAWLLGAHRRAARAPTAQHTPAALRAHHEERSARIGDEHAIAVLDEAAAATVRLTPATAARWLGAALRLLPAGPKHDAHRIELLFRRAEALIAAGRLDEAHEMLEQVVGAMAGFETEEGVRAVGALALVELMQGRGDQARATAAEALAALPEMSGAGAALLRILLALHHEAAGEWRAARDLAALAAKSAEQTEPGLAAAATGLCAVAETGLGRIAAARSRAAAGSTLLDALSHRPGSGARGTQVRDDMTEWASYLVGLALLDVDRITEALRHAERGLSVARATRHEHVFVPLRMVAAYALTALGRLDAAAEHSTAAVETARLLHAPRFTAFAATAACLVGLRSGDLGSAIAAGEQTLVIAADGVDVPRVAAPLIWFAEALLDAGEPARARGEILAAGDGPSLRRMEPVHRVMACEVLTRTEIALGNVTAAPRWSKAARTEAERLRLGTATATALRATAHAELGRGNADAASDAALRAAAGAARAGAVLDAARARLLAGVALTGTHPERAARHLERAHADLHACGARRMRDEAARELRKLGRPAPVAAGRPPGVHEIGTLTERESEIAALVFERLTNSQIASRLALSEKTVENHLARIFDKLAVRSRVEVARAWGRSRAAG